jgi:hypothetical protein
MELGMSKVEDRGASITLRCVMNDLGLAIPPVSEGLETLRSRSPIVAKFYDMAPVAPLNQDPVLSIRDTKVYRFKHRSHRVATWIEKDTDLVWLVAVAFRREDSDDAYDYFEGLHAAGDLLPSPEDRLRYQAEETTRFLHTVTVQAPDIVEAAYSRPGQEIRVRIAGELDLAVCAVPSEGVWEVWLAVSKKKPDGSFAAEQLRREIFAIFEEAIGAGAWEEQSEWPTRRLEWHEVARLYVA